jgi:hypothetical protein
VRVMKARRESVCPLCLAPIRVGQVIAKGGVWAHVGCIIDRAVKLQQETVGGGRSPTKRPE